MSALALCLVTGTLQVALPATSFTLAWRHTVENVLWEEDYRLAGDGLLATAARVRGSGAGMEPPAGALLREGVWHYAPARPRLRELTLARSEFGADYQLCMEGRCRQLGEFVPMGSGPVTVRPCR